MKIKVDFSFKKVIIRTNSKILLYIRLEKKYVYRIKKERK